MPQRVARSGGRDDLHDATGAGDARQVSLERHERDVEDLGQGDVGGVNGASIDRTEGKEPSQSAVRRQPNGLG